MSIPGMGNSDVSAQSAKIGRASLDEGSRFLGVDALWALCMALNVYLALFRGWTAQRMRGYEWAYIAGCYGCSFVPALAYLFINTKSRGKIYGPALVSTSRNLRSSTLTWPSSGAGLMQDGTFFE